jgi:uracil-DNA glycosylase family 4
MFVLSRPSEEDEINGRLLSSTEKNKFKTWISVASEGKYPKLIVTASLRCNSVNNKLPTTVDIRTCANLHLYKEICFMRPNLIVSFGNKALAGILNTRVSTTSDHQLLTVHKATIRHPNFSTPWVGDIYPLYHPSFFEMGLGGDKEDDCIKLLKQAFKANHVNNI